MSELSERVGGTTFQWLIERGQPEKQEPTVWLEHSVRYPARDKHWTTDANEAAMFPTRESAEEYIWEHFTHPVRGPSARAVEHGFMAALTEEEILRSQLAEAEQRAERLQAQLAEARRAGDELRVRLAMHVAMARKDIICQRAIDRWDALATAEETKRP